MNNDFKNNNARADSTDHGHALFIESDPRVELIQKELRYIGRMQEYINGSFKRVEIDLETIRAQNIPVPARLMQRIKDLTKMIERMSEMTEL